MWLRELVTKMLINPIIRTRTRQFRHAYHPTRANIKLYLMKTSCEDLDWILVVECKRILAHPDMYFVRLWRSFGISWMQLYLCRYRNLCFRGKLPSVAMSEQLFPLCLYVPKRQYSETFLVCLTSFGEILERYIEHKLSLFPAILLSIYKFE
jgi:hypothetical protein